VSDDYSISSGFDLLDNRFRQFCQESGPYFRKMLEITLPLKSAISFSSGLQQGIVSSKLGRNCACPVVDFAGNCSACGKDRNLWESGFETFLFLLWTLFVFFLLIVSIYSFSVIFQRVIFTLSIENQRYNRSHFDCDIPFMDGITLPS
jgi:hypothetical protein